MPLTTRTTAFTICNRKTSALDKNPSGAGEEVLVQQADEIKVKAGPDEAVEKRKAGLDEVTESVQKSLTCLKYMKDHPYPHLVVVKETKTDGKKSLLSKLRGRTAKDKTLHFLCPIDMSEVPCGENGEGYRFRTTRDWARKLSPVLRVTNVTAKVALLGRLLADSPRRDSRQDTGPCS